MNKAESNYIINEESEYNINEEQKDIYAPMDDEHPHRDNFKKFPLIDRENFGFTQIDNRVITGKIGHLSSDAKTAYTVLLSLPNDWSLNMTWLKNICGFSKNRLSKAKKELKDKGFLECDVLRINGKMAYNYKVFELPKNMMSSIQETEFQEADCNTPKSDERNQPSENGDYINKNNKKEHTNKKKKKEETNISRDEISINSKREVSVINHTENHEVINENEKQSNHVNSNKHISQEKINNISEAANLNNSSFPATKNKQKKDIVQASKQVIEKSEDTKKKEARTKEAVNNKKLQKRKNEVFTLIENEYDGDLKQVLLAYFNWLIDLGKPVAKENYHIMIENLEQLSGGNQTTEIQIVKQSLMNCWRKFFPLQSDSISPTITPAATVATSKKHTTAEIKRFFDKDGKPITFG